MSDTISKTYIPDGSLSLKAQDTGAENVNNIHDFLKILRAHSNQSKLRKSPEPFKLNNEGSLTSNLKAFVNEANLEIYSGKVLGEKHSNVVLEVNNNKVTGTIILSDKKTAYKYRTDDAGSVILETTPINKIICIDSSKAPVHKSKRATAVSTPSNIFHSNINAPATIYLDFDGEYVVSPSWNGGQPINALPSGLTADDIKVVMNIVAEDYAPFNVDVTNDRAYYDSKPFGAKHMNIITPTRVDNDGSGGVARIGSFTWKYFCPSWTYHLTPKGAAEAATHEVGHTLGLEHDGGLNPISGAYVEHFPGHNNWGPIMGGALTKDIVQFSKGEYQSANNI